MRIGFSVVLFGVVTVGAVAVIVVGELPNSVAVVPISLEYPKHPTTCFNNKKSHTAPNKEKLFVCTPTAVPQ